MSRSHAVFTACNSSIPEHLQGTSTPSSGDQLWQVPRSQFTGSGPDSANHPNICTMHDAPCKASVKRTRRITSHLRTVSLHLCDLVDQLWNCVSSQHLDQCELRQCMTFLCLETSLQCRRVMTPLASSITAKNWCLETVLPLLFLCMHR